MTIILETDRLIVKQTTLAHFEEIYPLVSDPDVMRYVSDGIRSREKTLEILKKIIAHQDKHGFSIGCVYEKGTNNLIGRAGLIYLELDDTQPEIEIGYYLFKRYWNKGYATELAKAFLNWGFKHLKINKIITVINPENHASRHVLKKAGMHFVNIVPCYGIQAEKYEIERNDHK